MDLQHSVMNTESALMQKQWSNHQAVGIRPLGAVIYLIHRAWCLRLNLFTRKIALEWIVLENVIIVKFHWNVNSIGLGQNELVGRNQEAY